MGSTANTLPPGKRNWIPALVVVVILFVLPFVLARMGRTGEYWIWVTTEMIIMALFAMSLNIILGFGGMVSFGHAAFFGVGAYAVALLTKKAGVSLFLALLTAPVAAAVAAAIIGWFLRTTDRPILCYSHPGLWSASVHDSFSVVHLYRRR